jgi:carbonic anhydrase/acetyltransferase-like protein (isoleucine patch superfamily)
MQAIVLNHAVIGKNCLIGAGAIVPEGREIPDGSLVIGVGKVVRTLTDEEIATMHANNLNYQERAQFYAKSLKRIG